MIIEEESPLLKKTNEQLLEMTVNVSDHLPTTVENSIYYPKLKHLMLKEIVLFCKEKTELKEDLLNIREYIGTEMPESDIRFMFNELKDKYNNQNSNIGIDYHVEVTKIDFGVPVFVIIKRDEIYMKKFVFRFKKGASSVSLDGLTSILIPINEPKETDTKNILKAGIEK